MDLKKEVSGKLVLGLLIAGLGLLLLATGYLPSTTEGWAILNMFLGSWIAWFLYSNSKKWSAFVGLGGGFIIGVFSLSIPLWWYSDVKNVNSHQASVSAHAPSLGISTTQFKELFNKFSEEIDAPFHINQVKLDQNTFMVSFGESNALSGTITSEGNIEGLVSISSGDGTMQSGLKMFQLSTIITRTFNTSMSKQESAQLVLEMMQQNSKLPNATMSKKTVGDVEYFTSLSKQLGYWYGVQIPSNK